MSRVVVVAPLKERKYAEARLLIEQGPPFDPTETTLTSLRVYLTDREAIFVFEGPEARSALEYLIGEPEVWKAAKAWGECLAGRPRFADEAFSWVGGRED